MKCLSDDLAGVAITFHQGTSESLPFGPSRGLSEYRKCCACHFLVHVLIVGQQSISTSSEYGVLAYLNFLP